jgi:hypothetical protein
MLFVGWCVRDSWAMSFVERALSGDSSSPPDSGAPEGETNSWIVEKDGAAEDERAWCLPPRGVLGLLGLFGPIERGEGAPVTLIAPRRGESVCRPSGPFGPQGNAAAPLRDGGLICPLTPAGPKRAVRGMGSSASRSEEAAKAMRGLSD